MKKNYFLLSVIVTSLMIIMGCQKDCTCPAAAVTITNTDWMMTYSEGSSGNWMYYAPKTFIGGGRAYFPSNLFHQGFWFSSYMLPIPKEIKLNLDTDSVRLVMNMRNVAGDGTAFEMDMGVGFASDAYCSAAFQKNGSSIVFCLLQVGSQVLNNLTEHLTNTSAYAEYSISIVGPEHQLTSYKNGSALRTFTYTGSTGFAQSITFAFRGYGECDWVKLYKGSKLIMTEDFNVDGATSAVWTLP